MTDTIKGGRKCQFKWTKDSDQSFEYSKTRVAQQPILVLPDFNKVFTIEIDASKRAIGGVLSQEGRLAALFSEKRNEAKHKYSTYDLEMYTMARSLRKWKALFTT